MKMYHEILKLKLLCKNYTKRGQDMESQDSEPGFSAVFRKEKQSAMGRKSLNVLI